MATTPSASSPFVWHHWSPSSTQRLETGVLLSLREGETLIEMGEPMEYVYYVQQGRLNVLLDSPAGAVKIVGFIDEGATFAEAAAFMPPDARSPVSAVAATDTSLRSISVDVFRGYLTEPEFCFDLAASMAHKQVGFIRQIEDLSFRNVRGRVACLLATLVGEGEKPGKRLSISQDTIADLVAAHRVSVSHALQDLEKMGLLMVGRQQITVLDPMGLRRQGLAAGRQPGSL